MSWLRGARLLLVGALLLVVAACGSNDDDLGPPEFDTGVSVEEALAMPVGANVTVNGWLAEPVSENEAHLCTALERPEPYLIECVEPSMVVLLRMDRYPGAKESQGSTWVDEPLQLTGKLVQLEGRAVDLDPYDCLEDFSSERCRLPTWWINPSAASAVSPTAEATTQRQVLIPPAGTVTDEAEIEAEVPWPIVLPSYLPPGYDKIGLLRVDKPSELAEPEAQARTIRVTLGFTGGPQGPGFMYILSGGHVGTDGAEAVLVNGQPAEYGVNAQDSQTLSWDLCGRTLMLGADADVSKDELIRIAESVPEQCG